MVLSNHTNGVFQMPFDKDKQFIICSRRTEADMVRGLKFLQTFTMVSDGKAEVCDLGEKQADRPNTYCDRWAIVMPKYYQEYTITIEKMQNGLRDFEAGYNTRLQEEKEVAEAAEQAAVQKKMTKAKKNANNPKLKWGVVRRPAGGSIFSTSDLDYYITTCGYIAMARCATEAEAHELWRLIQLEPPVG